MRSHSERVWVVYSSVGLPGESVVSEIVKGFLIEGKNLWNAAPRFSHAVREGKGQRRKWTHT